MFIEVLASRLLALTVAVALDAHATHPVHHPRDDPDDDQPDAGPGRRRVAATDDDRHHPGNRDQYRDPDASQRKEHVHLRIMGRASMFAPARYLADFARFVTPYEIHGIEITVTGMSFYHQGSANLIDDAVRSRNVDVFLAGVAGRGFTHDYWRRILTRLQPHTIVPTHYDDFFRPLDAEMGFTTNVNLAHVPDEVAAVSRDISVAALPITPPLP